MRTVTYWASLGMIFAISWENIVNVQVLGTISRAVGLLVAMLWVLSVAHTDRLRKPRAFHVAFLVFVLWHAASIFWTVDTEKTSARLFTYLQLFVFVYLLWDLYTTPASLRAAFQALVLGACVSIGSVISNYHAGVEESYQRFSATGFNPNEVGLVLALGLPLAWHLALFEEYETKSYWLRMVNFVYIPAAFLAVVLTGSRAAFLSTLPAFLFMLWSLSRVKLVWRVSALVLLAGSLVALLPVVPAPSIERLSDQNMQDRLSLWRESVDSISRHPLLGVGTGAYEGADSGKVAHNVVLSLLADVGTVGFTLFCIVFATALYHLRFLPRRDVGLWLTLLLVWLINGGTHNYEYTKQIWLLLSLLVASAHAHPRAHGDTPNTAAPRTLALGQTPE